MNSPASWIDRDEVARLLASLGEIAPVPPASEPAAAEGLPLPEGPFGDVSPENGPLDVEPVDDQETPVFESEGEVPWVEPSLPVIPPSAPRVEGDEEYGDLPEPPPFSLAQSLRVAATLTAVRNWADEGGLLKRRVPAPEEAEALDALPPVSELPGDLPEEPTGEAPTLESPAPEPEIEPAPEGAPDETAPETAFEEPFEPGPEPSLELDVLSEDPGAEAPLEAPFEPAMEPASETDAVSEELAPEETFEAPFEPETEPETEPELGSSHDAELIWEDPEPSPEGEAARVFPKLELFTPPAEPEAGTEAETKTETVAETAAELPPDEAEEPEAAETPPPDVRLEFHPLSETSGEEMAGSDALAPGFTVTPLPAPTPGPRLADRMAEFVKLVAELTEGDLLALLDRDGHALSFPPKAEEDPAAKREFVQSITQMARAMRRWGRPLGLDPDTAMHFPSQSEWLCLVPILARGADPQSWIYLALRVPHPIDPFLLERFRRELGGVIHGRAG